MRVYAPGETINVKRLQHVQGTIYADNNGMHYRVIEGHVSTVHGDLEYAKFTEQQYRERQAVKDNLTDGLISLLGKKILKDAENALFP